MAEILLKMSYKKFDTNDAQKVMISKWGEKGNMVYPKSRYFYKKGKYLKKMSDIFKKMADI